jgi:hypothetical protein
MNSVTTDRAGTASGVNNAVARIAGVLTIAIVGAIALIVFAGALQARTSPLNIPEAARAALASESSRLGAAIVPPQVPAESVAAVESMIKLAFVDMFNLVMWISAAMAWLAAIMAGVLVEPRAPGKKRASQGT